MKILVVGGGTAGFISAIILKKYLDFEVDVVFSKDVGIVGVGEGSTEHFGEFMRFAGISDEMIIKECDATYKAGIMFENWGKKDYLHNVGGLFTEKHSQYSYVYARQVAYDTNYMNPVAIWKSKIDRWFLNKKDTQPFNQYHFNTYKLNDFLNRFSQSIGINIFEDTLSDVIFREDGNIDKVISNTAEYKYDFYIDATGFKKMLIGKMGAKWKSFSDYLTLNSAITFRTEDTDSYNLWTLSRGMDSGWMFRIPTWGSHGNGYIYDKNFISQDEAKIEIEKYFGREVSIGKEFSFDPGALDKAWIKNCVAIGLSSIFIEPLEASSIGSSIQQAFLLMHKLSNYSDKEIENYNKSFNDITQNIRDFVILHYLTGRKDTEYWKNVSDMPIPNDLSEKIKMWRNKLPIQEDFNNSSPYRLFNDQNFILVMDGLNLFNRESILKEYLSHPEHVRKNADSIISQLQLEDQTLTTLDHKNFIKIIRENF